MADERSRSKGKPPPYFESYLTAKQKYAPLKIKARKYYCVLYGNLLQCFTDERSYTEKRENVKAQIDLDLVRSISETVSLPARKPKHDFCFKLVFYNESELDFAAQSKQDVKTWVDCLKETMTFWASATRKEEQFIEDEFVIVNGDGECNKIKETKEDTICKECKEETDPSLTKLSIIHSHGQPYLAYMAANGNIDDLWSAVLQWLPGHFCDKCYTCRLRRSTTELWSVTQDGVAFKITNDFNAVEYLEAATIPVIYLLEHNFKLLVVHFEDSTFLVSPADILTKARDIPNMELFSRKLCEIECNDAQLYLRTASGTVTPFSLEDAPLKTVWKQHGSHWTFKARQGEKFLFKSKAILSDNQETIAKKVQQYKLKSKFEERRQREALSKIEVRGCKQKIFKPLFKPLVPGHSKALPFDLSLTCTSGRNQEHFNDEWEVDTQNTIKHCKFVSSPEKKGQGQLTSPFCPPDSLEFNVTPAKDNNVCKEITERPETSLTDEVTLNKTGNGTEECKIVSHPGSIIRKGAIRRNSSILKDDLLNVELNVSHQTCENLSRDDSQQENNMTTADNLDSLGSKASSGSEDMQSINEQFNICGKDDEFNAIVSYDEVCGTSLAAKNGENSKNAGLVLSSQNNDKNELDNKKDVEHDSRMDYLDSSVEQEGRVFEFNNDCPSVNGRQENRHSCDLFVVESPYFLKNILDLYSRLSIDEEEVGVDLPPRGICLSSYHLVHVQGRWVVEKGSVLDEEDECCEHQDGEIFQLSEHIKVLFNRSKRTWYVKKINVEENIEENISATKEIPELVLHSNNQINNGSNSVGQSSNEDSRSIEEMRELELRQSPWKGVFKPLTINNCGQHFEPIDDLYEMDDQPITNSPVRKPPTLLQDLTEVKILEDAIQKLFYHIEKYRTFPASECLDDMKFPDVRRLVCIDLCSALSNILSNGLKKKYTLLSAIRYTVWEVVKGTCTSHITNLIVKKINSAGALDDKIRFELFVCECLNQGSGAMAMWLETLQNNRKKLHLFYDERSLVMRLPKDTLEKLISRITFLPFNITLFQHVLKKMEDAKHITQFGFE